MVDVAAPDARLGWSYLKNLHKEQLGPMSDATHSAHPTKAVETKKQVSAADLAAAERKAAGRFDLQVFGKILVAAWVL